MTQPEQDKRTPKWRQQIRSHPHPEPPPGGFYDLLEAFDYVFEGLRPWPIGQKDTR